MQFVKRCCPHNYMYIENFEMAVNDTKNLWVCHHRNGEQFDIEWLKKNNVYYNREDYHEFKCVPVSKKYAESLGMLCHMQLHKKPGYWLGKKQPKELVQKRVNANKNHVYTEQERMNRSAAQKGKTYSQVALENIKLGAKKRWQDNPNDAFRHYGKGKTWKLIDGKRHWMSKDEA